jgi:ribonuclease BN (tRNA processing enzyme)
MRVTFLGTNGWYDTKTGNTVCVLIETEREYLILDAGNGFYKIDRHIVAGKPIYLFLSHLHWDHIVGLHILNKFHFPQGINIYGAGGFKKYLSAVIRQPFTAPLRALKTPVRLHDLRPGMSLPFPLVFKRLRHVSSCHGFRLVLEGKTIAYCTDTGLCKNLYLLAREADLLIAECGYLSGQSRADWPHLNPESAAQVALEAGVKRLALIHFDASLYKTLKHRAKAEKKARRLFPNTLAAKDNDWIKI